MADEKTVPQATATQELEPEPNKRSPRAKIAAVVVAGSMLVLGSSFAASLAFASAMGDKGPQGPDAGSQQAAPTKADCSDGPPEGLSRR